MTAELRRLGWHEVSDRMVVIDKIGDVWIRRGKRMEMIWDGETWCAGGVFSKGLSGNVCPPDLIMLADHGDAPTLRRLEALIFRPGFSLSGVRPNARRDEACAEVVRMLSEGAP